jgi:ATP-binding protein involved in chromosome partitioning
LIPMAISKDDILNVLRQIEDPELHRDLVTLNMIRDLAVEGGTVRFTLMLTTPACPLRDRIKREAEEAIQKIPGVKKIEIIISAEVGSTAPAANVHLPAGIKNIVAVASGKGGVGKSTTAVNLAVCLRKAGAKVGLLDADIYGPNIPMMMGIAEKDRPTVNDQERLIPFENHGVKVMSLAFLVEPGKAVIWRGPMLHGVIRQFLTTVEWGELDYLIVDLPPGTGDAPLSLAQIVPLSGAVMVTTPQEVALSDVRRSIAMFEQVRVPVLGIIENMSGLECPHCRKNIALFDGQGGKTLSEEFKIPLLGQIPFDPSVGQSGDRGVPISMANPDSPQARAFRSAAEWVAARISVLQRIPSPLGGEGGQRPDEGYPSPATLSPKGRGDYVGGQA